MTNKQLKDAFKEIYRLWYLKDTDDEIEFILNAIMSSIENE